MAVTPFDKQLEEHAKAIGFVCIHWTRLEQITDTTLAVLLKLPMDSIEAHCIMVEMDFRQKLKSLKHIAFAKKPSEEWFANLEKLVNYIDNDLRSARNRYVHDIWTTISDGSEVQKTYQRVRLKRPQSHQPYTMSVIDHSTIDSKELTEGAKKIIESANEMLRLFYQIPGFAEAMSE